VDGDSGFTIDVVKIDDRLVATKAQQYIVD
jgi:hypothetical protein